MSKETSDKLEAFRASVASEAEDIIFRIFPSKIIELSTTIESANAPDSPYSISQAAAFTDTRVYPPPSTSHSNDPSLNRNYVEDDIVPFTNELVHAKYPELVHANKHILKLQDIIREECTQLTDSCDKVRLWVNLTMPKIEDGNNFGVEIQERKCPG
jgi:proteasome activator subunit 3 (PA28 gamma)